MKMWKIQLLLLISLIVGQLKAADMDWQSSPREQALRPQDIEEPQALFDKMSIKDVLNYGRTSKAAHQQLLNYAPGIARHGYLIRACSQDLANQILKRMYTGSHRDEYVAVGSLTRDGPECLEELRQLCSSHDQGHLKMNRLASLSFIVSSPSDLQALATIHRECPIKIKFALVPQHNHDNGFTWNYFYSEMVDSLSDLLSVSGNRVQSLELSALTIAKNDFIQIIRALQLSKNLNQLILNDLVLIKQRLQPGNHDENQILRSQRATLDQSLVRRLANMVQEPGNNFKMLQFSDTRSEADAFAPLFHALKSPNNRVSSLIISRIDSEPLDLEPLFDGLASINCRIRMLDLTGLELDDENHAFRLIETLEVSNALKIRTLRLAENDFSEQGTSRIVEYLTHPENEIVMLDVADTLFNAESINRLSQILHHEHCRLKRLWISLEHIIDEPGALILLRFLFPRNSEDFLPAGHSAILKSATLDPSTMLAMINAAFQSANVSIEYEQYFTDDERNTYRSLEVLANFYRSAAHVTLHVDH